MCYIKYYLIFDEFSVFIAYFSSEQMKSHKFIIKTEDDLISALKKINNSVYYTYFTQCDFIYYLKDSYSRKTIDSFISDYLSPEIKNIKNFKITEVNYEEFELQIKIDIEQIKLNKLSKKDDDFQNNKNIKDSLNIAFDLYNGKNCEKDVNKAINIFEKCAESNSIKAARFLANYYTKVCKNSQKALKYFNIFEANIDYDKKFYTKEDWVICITEKDNKFFDENSKYSEKYYNYPNKFIEEYFIENQKYTYKCIHIYSNSQLTERIYFNKNNKAITVFKYQNKKTIEKIRFFKTGKIKSITKYSNELKLKKYLFNKNELLTSMHKFEEDFLYEKIYFDENKNIKTTATYKKGFDEYDKAVLLGF